MFAVIYVRWYSGKVVGTPQVHVFLPHQRTGAAIVQQVFWYFELHTVVSALNTAYSSGTFEGLRPYFSAVISRQMTISEVLNQKEGISICRSPSVHRVGVRIVAGFRLAFSGRTAFPHVYSVPIKARWFVLGYAVVELFGSCSVFGRQYCILPTWRYVVGALLISYWKKRKLYR